MDLLHEASNQMWAFLVTSALQFTNIRLSRSSETDGVFSFTKSTKSTHNIYHSIDFFHYDMFRHYYDTLKEFLHKFLKLGKI
jgi:hypothetical protein